jgi:hypothetical protein
MFIFKSEDSFFNFLKKNKEIYRIYKLIGNKMIGLKDINFFNPGFDMIINNLKFKKINKIFTGAIFPKSYFELESK